MPWVIVDTSAWVQYFRVPDSAEGDEVERLIRESRAAVVGMVYGELVRGARDDRELRSMEEKLGALPFLQANKETWRRVGRLLFDLRRRGVSMPLADALIAVQALEGDHALYTLDEHFQRVPGLRLHEAKAG